jgi:hypothetical protein
MRLGKFAVQIVPAIALATGSAFAADPDPTPLPTSPLETGVVVSKPLAVAPDSAPAQGIAPPPTVTSVPNAQAEPQAKPRAAEEKYVVPPPTSWQQGVPTVEDILSDPRPYQPPLAWSRAEFLFWTMSGGHVQPLATTGPAGAPIAVPGFPGRTTVFGDNDPLSDPRSGAKFTIGSWLDSSRTIGVEASGFWLSQQRSNFLDGSLNGSRIVASSPFVDPTTNLATSVLISFPGVAAGTTDIAITGRSLWGAEALLRPLLAAGDGWRLDGLAGFRYRGFAETLDIHNTVEPLAAPGTTIVSQDSLRAENTFQGGALGFDYQKDCGSWIFTVRPTVGIGPMFTTVDRNGVTVIRAPGTADLIFPGGIYNLPSNGGQVHSNDWTVIPELDVRVSKMILDCLRLSVGYSAIYLPSVARVGEQIDPFVNPGMIPPAAPGGPLRPFPILEHSSMWLQGFTVGMELRF